MSVVAALLDKAKNTKSITSDNALSHAVGTNRQVISQWRHGDAYPSEENIVLLAEMAGDDPVQWLVAIKAVRSHGAAGKAWASLAKRLAATAMAVVITFGMMATNFSEKAYAASTYTSELRIDCILCSVSSPEFAQDCLSVIPTRSVWLFGLLGLPFGSVGRGGGA